LSKVENQISSLENDIKNDDKALASNYNKAIEDAAFFMAYKKKKQDLDKLLAEWESIQEEIAG
jgi:ATP-binding cassette, subfamily F, member 3